MDKPIDVNPTKMPKAEILSEEQAQNYVVELVDEMNHWRQQCNVSIPGNRAATVKQQQRASWTYLTKQGQVIGALSAFKLAGLISDRCYQELKQNATNAVIPSVVGRG